MGLMWFVPPQQWRRLGFVQVYLDNMIKHCHRFFFWALEGIAANDRSVAATVADGCNFFIDAVEILGLAA